MSFNVEPWMMWAGAAVVFFIVEMLTPGLFVFACFALAAVAASLCTYLGVSSGMVWIIFLAGSLVLVIGARTLFSEYLEGTLHPSNVDALIGKDAVVIKSITPHQAGTVKVGSETWCARSGRDISSGEIVKVSHIDGNHLIVNRK